MSGIRVELVGGRMEFPGWTTKFNEKEQARIKAQVWLHMLNEHRKPTRFYKTMKNGTGVKFACISSQEQYDEGIEEWKLYLKEIKEIHGIDIRFGLAKEDNS